MNNRLSIILLLIFLWGFGVHGEGQSASFENRARVLFNSGHGHLLPEDEIATGICFVASNATQNATIALGSVHQLSLRDGAFLQNEFQIDLPMRPFDEKSDALVTSDMGPSDNEQFIALRTAQISTRRRLIYEFSGSSLAWQIPGDRSLVTGFTPSGYNVCARANEIHDHLAGIFPRAYELEDRSREAFARGRVPSQQDAAQYMCLRHSGRSDTAVAYDLELIWKDGKFSLLEEQTSKLLPLSSQNQGLGVPGNPRYEAIKAFDSTHGVRLVIKSTKLKKLEEIEPLEYRQELLRADPGPYYSICEEKNSFEREILGETKP